MVVLSPGSSRLAYQWAQALGHKLQAPVPSLFTFKIQHALLAGLAGLSVQDAEVSLVSDAQGKGKKKLKERGPILVTHQGLSGPAILRLSAFGARELHAIDYQARIRVNWKPDMPGGHVSSLPAALSPAPCLHSSLFPLFPSSLAPALSIDLHLPEAVLQAKSSIKPLLLPTHSETRPGVEGVVEELEAYKKFQGSKTIGGTSGPTLDLPRRLWQGMVADAGIAPDLKWCDVKKADLRRVAMLVAQCEFEVTGKSTNKDEFVTAGGVSLAGVDMSRMASKSVPGLFFCGEVLDIDGITGGYNLQSAWTTGTIAGRSLVEMAA